MRESHIALFSSDENSALSMMSSIILLLSLILTIMLRFKVRTISMMLLFRPFKAAPAIPNVLYAISTTVETPTIDGVKVWMSHVQHVPNLLPVELLILLVLMGIKQCIVVG